jgi:hypothetical protein
LKFHEEMSVHLKMASIPAFDQSGALAFRQLADSRGFNGRRGTQEGMETAKGAIVRGTDRQLHQGLTLI